MKCKECNKTVDDNSTINQTVRYIKKDWKNAGKYAGSPEYCEEITIDGGLFCCDECLIKYLSKR